MSAMGVPADMALRFGVQFLVERVEIEQRVMPSGVCWTYLFEEGGVSGRSSSRNRSGVF